eukprot:3141986-Amphidinium_carterae.2
MPGKGLGCTLNAGFVEQSSAQILGASSPETSAPAPHLQDCFAVVGQNGSTAFEDSLCMARDPRAVGNLTG